MARIIMDSYYSKDKPIWGDDPTTPFNQKILAINSMYGWLFEQGILKEVCFEFKKHADIYCFAFDAKDLEPFRIKMKASGLAGANLAIQHIFDESYTPCLYSGVIELGWTMHTYRDVDGCVGSSWECNLIKGLNTETIYDISQVRDEYGVRAAVKTMLSYYVWDPVEEKAKASLNSVMQSADDKKNRNASVGDRKCNDVEHDR